MSVDVRYSARNDLENVLWRSVIYPTISGYRALLSRPPSRGKRGKQFDVYPEFVRFVDETSAFYQQRVHHYQTAYRLELTTAEFLRFDTEVADWGLSFLTLTRGDR